ncbi:MAG: hypothetical protein JW918_01315 [Anaerolineae bacterium]|nr:hypothetical protein [Anaerolineae bacterium]
MNETVALEKVTALARRLPPLDQIRLIEQLMPTIEREFMSLESPDESLAAWQQVYAELSEEDIATVEQIATDRSDFMRQVA